MNFFRFDGQQMAHVLQRDLGDGGLHSIGKTILVENDVSRELAL